MLQIRFCVPVCVCVCLCVFRATLSISRLFIPSFHFDLAQSLTCIDLDKFDDTDAGYVKSRGG